MPISHTEVVNKARPTGIKGLWRLTFDDPREKFWIGTLRWNKQGVDHAFQGPALGKDVVVNGVSIKARPVDHADPGIPYDNDKPPVASFMPDSIFYVEEAANGNHTLKVDLTPDVRIADGEWDFLPYRFTDKNAENKEFWGLLTDGQSHLIQVYRTTNGGKVIPGFRRFWPSNAGIESNGGDPTSIGSLSANATFGIYAVRHLANYTGSIVYAGFDSWNPKTGADRGSFPHWAVFSDTVGTAYSAYSVDTTTTLRIGDDPSEPITGVVVSSASTDVMGIKGQLLFFTPRKIQVFDGFPPLPDGDLPQNFMSPLPPTPIGTWASRTIVRTPMGIMFLGADGIVYLIPFRGLPIPVGRALEPHFAKLNEFQQKNSAATYVDGHYLLSVPLPDSTSLEQYETWFADIRQFNPQQFDGGVLWTGPHPMPPISAYAVGYGLGDGREVKAGSAISSQIFDVWRKDLQTDAPTRNSNPFETSVVLPKQLAIRTHAVSNPMDLGDVHADKILRNAQIMIGTNNQSQVTFSVSAIAVSEVTNSLEVNLQEKVATITPQLGLLGGTTLVLPSSENTQPVSLEPDDVLFGRMFVIEIREETGATADKDTAPFFQDLSFEITPVPRRD